MLGAPPCCPAHESAADPAPVPELSPVLFPARELPFCPDATTDVIPELLVCLDAAMKAVIECAL